MPIVSTPDPPYVAVIFTSVLVDDPVGYAETMAHMEALVQRQPGYLGLESARDEIGVSVSYWSSEDDARAWKQVAEHALAQERGKREWYESYRLRMATVTREYGQP